jgi:plasmid maintenance system antidote protein VapI
MAKKRGKLPPIPPGETLLEDFLKPLGLSANRLSTASSSNARKRHRPWAAGDHC